MKTRWMVLILYVVSFHTLFASESGQLGLETPPCPEPTDACLEALEQRYLSEAGAFGMDVDRFLKPGTPAILRVSKVTSGGPAAAGGLEVGDWILAWDDLSLVAEEEPARTQRYQEHLVRLFALRRGDKVRFEVLSGKDGARRVVEIVAGPAPPEVARERLAADLFRRYGKSWYSAYNSYFKRRYLAANQQVLENPTPLPTPASAPAGSSPP